MLLKKKNNLKVARVQDNLKIFTTLSEVYSSTVQLWTPTSSVSLWPVLLIDRWLRSIWLQLLSFHPAGSC